MVLMRNNVQKESTYGWYPSQVNVYENARAKHGYDKECLFRHWESTLHHTNPEGVASVTPPGFRGSMRSRSRSSKASMAKSPDPQPNMLLRGTRPASLVPQDAPPQFVFEKSRPSSASYQIPTPGGGGGRQSHHGWQPQPTILGIVDPNGPFIAPSPKLERFRANSSHIETPKPSDAVRDLARNQLRSRPQTPAQDMSGSYRAQSASLLGRSRTTPTRSIKSAGFRPAATASASPAPLLGVTGASVSRTQNITDAYNIEVTDGQAWPQAQLTTEAEVGEEEEQPDRPLTPVNFRTPSPVEDEGPTYEEQLDKYGWLAEVHGDPFHLKTITKRLPYTVKCKEPTVGEYPYKTRVMAGDTFFLNTIPRKPMTFAVHPEWQSEGFVAKRKELQKQGRQFHVRNFGFAY